MSSLVPRVVGSSLLPICRDKRWGNIYFLLGKERRHPNWDDADSWADFSGSTKVLENGNFETPEQTASREAWEETASIVKFTDFDNYFPIENPYKLLENLMNGNFILKIEFDRGNGIKYVTYVYEIPWDPSIPSRFAHLMKVLTQRFPHTRATEESQRMSNTTLRAMFNDRKHPSINLENGFCDRSFTEKAAINLFGVPSLQKAIANNGLLVEKFGKREYLRSSFLNRLVVIMNHLNYATGAQPTYVKYEEPQTTQTEDDANDASDSN